VPRAPSSAKQPSPKKNGSEPSNNAGNYRRRFGPESGVRLEEYPRRISRQRPQFTVRWWNLPAIVDNNARPPLYAERSSLSARHISHDHPDDSALEKERR